MLVLYTYKYFLKDNSTTAYHTVAHWYHFQHFSRIFVYATFSFCLRHFFFVYATFFLLTCCSIRSSVQCYSAL